MWRRYFTRNDINHCRKWKMRILYSSSEIRQTIRDLFSKSNDRRVAIAAFVGASAEAYLPKPKGIEVICWPKAGGTNPNAVLDLIDRDVVVYFADAMHMKIYWTKDKGTVITSANLSTSALGVGGLKEIGVLLPPGILDIDKVIASLNIRLAKEPEISRLDRAHKNYIKATRSAEKRNAPQGRTFGKWYSLPVRPKWRLGWYICDTVRLSNNGKALLEKEHGSSGYEDLMTTVKGFFKEDDWILCFNVDSKKARWVQWMFAHHIVKVSPSDKKAYDRNAPYQVIQAHKLKVYDQPPFILDGRFKRAFSRAVEDHGGLEKMMDLSMSKPSTKLIDLIHQQYK